MIVLLAIPPVSSSAMLINGTLYYRNTTPQNDPMDLRVMPGDTIYQGRIYDLTHVIGVSKQFAWWKDWKYESNNCNPDRINSVSYIDTNGKENYKAVFIEPDEYPEGNWWQWDGCFERYDFKSLTSTMVPYMADNNLAFRVIRAPERPPKPVITEPTPEITYVPLQTVIVTMQPANNPEPEEKDQELPWYVYWIGLCVIIFLVWRFWE